MINFKQYLAESRSAPLYHGTNLLRLAPIFRQGLMPRTLQERRKLLKTDNYKGLVGKNKKQIHPHHMMGVSTSRSFKMASVWGEGIVLELDQRRLAQKYEIKPIQYFQSPYHDSLYPARSKDATGHDNEYEEFIITHTNIPPHYITRIYVPGPSANDDIIRDLARQYGSSFIVTY